MKAETKILIYKLVLVVKIYVLSLQKELKFWEDKSAPLVQIGFISQIRYYLLELLLFNNILLFLPRFFQGTSTNPKSLQNQKVKTIYEKNKILKF